MHWCGLIVILTELEPGVCDSKLGPLISVFIEEDSHEIGGKLDFPLIFIN